MEEKVDAKEEGNKIEKGYLSVVGKLNACLMQEMPKSKKVRLKPDAVRDLVKKLMQKKQDEVVTTVMTKFEEIMENYVVMNREFRKAEQEALELKNKKMKEFTASAQGLLDMIEGLPELEKEYTAGLTAAVAPKE